LKQGYHQLLRTSAVALSSQALKTTKDGDAPHLSFDLCQTFTSLLIKQFFGGKNKISFLSPGTIPTDLWLACADSYSQPFLSQELYFLFIYPGTLL